MSHTSSTSSWALIFLMECDGVGVFDVPPTNIGGILRGGGAFTNSISISGMYLRVLIGTVMPYVPLALAFEVFTLSA
jgi:hypothetical protein